MQLKAIEKETKTIDAILKQVKSESKRRIILKAAL